MNYPKEWLRIVGEWIGDGEAYRGTPGYEELLFRLNEAGALKDPPKPREWFFCEVHGCNAPFESGICHEAHRMEVNQMEVGRRCRIIHVREVTDE